MMSLAEAARVTGGRVSGNDARFAGVSTDSRSIGAGELFVALRGERFDGHQFLAAAATRGACAALVDNAQREHLEFMRNVDDVAAENASVYDALPPEGVAIVNADDAHAGFFR